jgi:multidrug resistance protein, MATE family
MVIPFKDKYLEIRRLLKESWAMGWPMILIMFFQFAIGLTDVYVAGYLGTDILAAVGYVAQLYWTLMIMANGLSVGTVSMVSQAYGAKSSGGVGCITGNSLLVGLCISGVLTVVAQLYPAAIVDVAGMPEGIQVIAESFIKVFSLVLIPTYVMIITGGVLRSSGRIQVTMVNSFVAASVNVAAELILSFGWGPIPAMGYIGIAWGTAIATTLGMTLNLMYVFSGPARVTLRSLTSPLYGCIRNLVKLGVPTALQQTAWNVGTLMVYFLVGRLQGNEITALAAMTAGVRIEAIIFLPIFALSMASAVLTGNRLGAGDVAGARSGAKVTALLCLAIIFLPATCIFILAPQISALLTQDPPVLQEMTRYLRINMIGMPFMAIGVTLSGALQGAGDTFATMRIIFTGMWLLRIPFILGAIYILQTSALGIWWSMTVSIVIMCGLLANRFRGNAWIKASVDKTTNTMLWEACLPGGERSGREDSVTQKMDSGA